MNKNGSRKDIKDNHYAELIKNLVSECNGDKEIIHIKADKILLEIIENELGFTETSKEFIKLEKWYA